LVFRFKISHSFLGKLTSDQEGFTGLMDTTEAQVDNLDDNLKKKFKQLVIFHEIGLASHGVSQVLSFV